MGNALGTIPSVMINRLADRAGTPQDAALLKVAELSQQLMQAVAQEDAAADAASPDGDAPDLALTSGAVVDRLI